MKGLNSRGSALMSSLIVSGLVAGVTAMILTQAQSTDKASRAPRVKAAMAIAETQIRNLARQSSTYIGCDTDLTGCSVNEAVIRSVERDIPGARCQSGTASCGIRVASTEYNSAARMFHAQIVYTGTEIPLSPINITIPISGDVLNPTDNCLDSWQTAPLFAGYNEQGMKLCKPLPNTCSNNPSLSLSDPGVYIDSINGVDLSLNCRRLNAVAVGSPTPTGCGPGQFIRDVNWRADGTFEVACSDRREVASAIEYNPASSQIGAATTGSSPVQEPSCGAANGGTFADLFTSSPNLCNPGTVTGFAARSAPEGWNWGCSQNGGVVGCSANKTPPPTTTTTTTTRPPVYDACGADTWCTFEGQRIDSADSCCRWCAHGGYSGYATCRRDGLGNFWLEPGGCPMTPGPDLECR